MIPARLVIPSRVRSEEHPVGFERRAQFAQHARQLLSWDVEQRGVGEYAVKAAVGKLQREGILLQDLAAAVLACQRGERREIL